MQDYHFGDGILEQSQEIAFNTSVVGGLTLTTMEFTVPLDWERDSTSETITIFVRKVVASDNEKKELPYLLFLQGGPGFPSPRPEGRYGWIKRATDEYQILLLDQRGTGLSNPLTHQTLQLFPTPHETALYLSYFRADSIVKDCEYIRKTLLGNEGQWLVLGQSYGGFILGTYMSYAPASLKGAIFVGGLPPLTIVHPMEVYRYTCKKVLEYNKMYYQRYPEDVQRVRKIVNYLRTHKVQLAGGGILTVRRFQQVGLGFGLGTFERVHYLIESAFIKLKRPSVGTTHLLDSLVGEEVLSYAFLRGIENMLDFETNPIYAILHESIYCQGVASNWAAERVMKEYPQFIPNFYDESVPVFFTGETIFSWMFDDYRYLQPLKMAAEILAQKDDWGPLYNLQQLANNNVPCSAIVYYDDMYVPMELSEAAARRIKGLQLWITNEYLHSGIHSGGEIILNKLLNMVSH